MRSNSPATLSRACLIFLFLAACWQQRPHAEASPSGNQPPSTEEDNPYPRLDDIPLPSGYKRIPVDSGSFAVWLRHLPLKRDKTVYLYDGSPKRNQDAQFAVLDISVGRQDLQQCADAVMRLRAEWLYMRRKPAEIDFYTEQGVRLNFFEWQSGARVRLSGSRLIPYSLSRGAGDDRPCGNRACFDEYLQTVFSYCGTRSLEKQLLSIRFKDMLPGDVMIKGGAPGHAMLVADMAEDAKGHRIYLLAQSYMPAQDIHIVKNPGDPALNPWYQVDDQTGLIKTPEWTFTTNQLRTWPPAPRMP